MPASLAKLFVIDYANEIADLNEIVHASPHALSMTKPGASTAGITEQEYYLHNLFAAMLVPSSNNAAYVVADYCGGILAPDASTSEKRVTAFMHGLQEHLTGIVCSDTVLYDPSGFDLEARTTVLDLKIVADRLLEKTGFGIRFAKADTLPLFQMAAPKPGKTPTLSWALIRNTIMKMYGESKPGRYRTITI